MLPRIYIAAFAILFVLCCHAHAATHPNTKKIAKWEGKITKLQSKIDAENAHTSSVSLGLTVAAPMAYVQSAPVQVQTTAPAPAAVIEAPAPAAELQAPATAATIYRSPIYVPPSIHYYDNNPRPRYYSPPRRARYYSAPADVIVTSPPPVVVTPRIRGGDIRRAMRAARGPLFSCP